MAEVFRVPRGKREDEEKADHARPGGKRAKRANTITVHAQPERTNAELLMIPIPIGPCESMRNTRARGQGDGRTKQKSMHFTRRNSHLTLLPNPSAQDPRVWTSSTCG